MLLFWMLLLQILLLLLLLVSLLVLLLLLPLSSNTTAIKSLRHHWIEEKGKKIPPEFTLALAKHHEPSRGQLGRTFRRRFTVKRDELTLFPASFVANYN